MISHTPRFIRLAQLLFKTRISDEEKKIAQQAIDLFNKIEIDFQNWLKSIENNIGVFKNYQDKQGKEVSLVVISDAFNETIEKQKAKYELIINNIKQTIEILDQIQDVEMQDMIVNLTKTSENFTELYNELTNMEIKIGEKGFIQMFKELSQQLIDNNETFFDVLARVKEYIQKNILGQQSLS